MHRWTSWFTQHAVCFGGADSLHFCSCQSADPTHRPVPSRSDISAAPHPPQRAGALQTSVDGALAALCCPAGAVKRLSYSPYLAADRRPGAGADSLMPPAAAANRQPFACR